MWSRDLFSQQQTFNCSTWRARLTHWGRETYICVNKRGHHWFRYWLVAFRRQAIIWTNAGLLSIGPLRTYFTEILIKIQQISLKKVHLKISYAKWRPSCLGLSLLKVPWSFQRMVFNIKRDTFEETSIKTHRLTFYKRVALTIYRLRSSKVCRLFGTKPLCWLIVNWTLGNKMQWNCNQYIIFFQKH